MTKYIDTRISNYNTGRSDDDEFYYIYITFRLPSFQTDFLSKNDLDLTSINLSYLQKSTFLLLFP